MPQTNFFRRINANIFSVEPALPLLPPPCPLLRTEPVLLCKLMNSIKPGLIKPGLPHTSRGKFPELENLSAFLSACQKMGVAKHSVFNKRDLHEKKDMRAVVRCLYVLAAAVQSTVPDFRGPFLGTTPFSRTFFFFYPRV